MPKEFILQVTPDIANNKNLVIDFFCKKEGISEKEILNIDILKKSIDSRNKQIKINLRINVFFEGEKYLKEEIKLPDYKNVFFSEPVIIIGAGPAGLFAGLQLVELGLKPIILERGKDVRNRRRDLKLLNQNNVIDKDSNYCFGEGGAGAYSDGKLYTRSKKRGDINKILKLLVCFGASEDILINSHPHIGTNKLPKIIENIRNKILEHGGEILFENRVTDIIIKNNQVKGVRTNKNNILESNNIILATGHSARDIYELLYKNKVYLEVKPFALGVRVEHPQYLIDKIQYGKERDIYLPPASYNLVKQIDGRGVYSFCMCPGGVIAPCATNYGEVVTNGWSPSKRDQLNANSGIVVELRIEDFKIFHKFGELSGIQFQKSIEQKAWNMAGETQKVPAQKMVDFTQKRLSTNIPKTSYIPGITSVKLDEVLPPFVFDRLSKGFKEFGKIMKGFFTDEAIIHAPESRTSSPVRIPRDPETLQHIHIKGLYPCGEGAGYSGGIISAGLDGQNCAVSIKSKET